MAKQRQTDVNINYKVNTVELEKGNTILQRASVATDKLRSDTNNFGKSAGQSFQNASKYIEGMEIQLARLRQQIKLTNTQDTARLKQLSDQYKALKGQVDAYNRSLFQQNTAQKQTAQSSADLARNFGQVVTAVKAFIAVGVTREIVNMSLEMAKLNGNVQGVERAFVRAFPGGQALLIDLRRATHGAVSDFELMQRTLQATNLGVSVEHLAVLFEFAATRAQQTGESVDYLVDSIVRGIGRKSILVLDNLGLSATRLREQFDGAAIASKSVADVTKGVAEIARVELAKMGGFVETTATEVDQLTVSWKELREEFAKTITEGPTGGIQGFLKGYIDSFKALFEAINRGIPVQEVFREQQRLQIAVTTTNEFLNRRLTESKEENVRILQEEIAAVTKEIGSWTNFRDVMDQNIATLQKELGQRYTKDIVLNDEIKTIERLRDANKEDALINQEIVKILQARLLVLQKVNKEEKTVIDRSLVTDPVRLFDPGKSAKLPTNEQMLKNAKDNLVDVQGILQDAADQLFIVLPVTVRPAPFVDSEMTKAWGQMQQEFFERSLDGTQALIDAELQREIDGYSMRIEALRIFYDEQQNLAGENQRVKAELRIKEDREIKKLEKERADREKKAALAGIAVNFALAIAKIWAGDGTWQQKLLRSIIVSAEGTTQAVIASRARYYAKGEIDIKGGTPGKDSIPAMLMPHETIMTADETASSKGIFKAVRARKLNDKVLKEIVSGRSGGQSLQSFDDSKIIKKLDEVKNATPDIALRAGMIYEGKKKGDNYIQWIRRKSMNP